MVLLPTLLTPFNGIVPNVASWPGITLKNEPATGRAH